MREIRSQSTREMDRVRQIQAATAHTNGAGRYTAAEHDFAMDRMLEDIIAMGDAEIVAEHTAEREPKLRLSAPMTQADLIGTDLSVTGQSKIACLA